MTIQVILLALVSSSSIKNNFKIIYQFKDIYNQGFNIVSI